MRNPGGYGIAIANDDRKPLALWFDRSSPYNIVRGKGKIEIDFFRCCHCGKHTAVVPKMDPDEMGGFCRLCMKPTCKHCHAKGNCDPLEKKLERVEAKDRFRRSLGF